MWKEYITPEVERNLIASLIFLCAFWILKWFIIRALRKWKSPNPTIRHRWIFHVRNGFFSLMVLGTVVIWASEIRSFAISIAAVAAALVIATKELILCFLGGLLKGSTRPFEIGDRIQVGEHRGDVMEHNFVTTTLYEVGPGSNLHQYTGRNIEIPNSLFLVHPIVNETHKQKFVLHTFKVPLMLRDDWRAAEKALLEAAREVSKIYIQEAKAHFEKMGEVQGIQAPSTDPRITLHFPEPKKIDLVVRMPAPSLRKGRVEQSVIRHFLNTSENQDLKGENPM